VKTLALLALGLLLAVGGCNKATQSNDAVKSAVMEHLKKGSGLDLGQMDVDVTSVKYDGNKADAVVSFKPKSAPDAGMQMSYQLESKGGKWEVVGKSGMGAAAGHGGGMPGASGSMPGVGGAGSSMPPGHPPAGGGAAPGGDAGALPPGHPPVSGEKSGQPK
jgi:hypothetical protein